MNQKIDSALAEALKIKPLAVAAARDLLRARFDGHEHWILIVDRDSGLIPRWIEDKYYRNQASQDFDIIIALFQGSMFGVVAARKRKMLAHQLASILRQMAGIRLTEREIVSHDTLLIVDPRRMDAAARLVEILLRSPDAEAETPEPFSVQASAPLGMPWMCGSATIDAGDAGGIETARQDAKTQGTIGARRDDCIRDRGGREITTFSERKKSDNRE